MQKDESNLTSSASPARRKWTLAELLAQCDGQTHLPVIKEWNRMPDLGLEVIDARSERDTKLPHED